jgi:hypothetical protein
MSASSERNLESRPASVLLSITLNSYPQVVAQPTFDQLALVGLTSPASVVEQSAQLQLAALQLAASGSTAVLQLAALQLAAS